MLIKFAISGIHEIAYSKIIIWLFRWKGFLSDVWSESEHCEKNMLNSSNEAWKIEAIQHPAVEFEDHKIQVNKLFWSMIICHNVLFLLTLS